MTLVDQRVFVTGATGFLGGALARRLAAGGARVRALARSERKAEALRDTGVEIVLGDITDAETMRRAADGCRVVFHAAAFFGDYARQRVVNIEGTRNVLQAATDAKVERFVHISSISVYGYKVAGDVTEATPAAPGGDPYAITKTEAETVVRSGGAPYTIIRPGMIYGAGSVNWTGQLFRLARRSPTPFIGDGHGSVFPIHVDDVVDLTVTAAAYPAAVNQIFNCTPDPSPTWREFLGAYARLAGNEGWRAIPPRLIAPVAQIVRLLSPRVSRTRDLPDLLRFTQSDITFKTTKAQDLLDWQPQVDLETGVAGCAEWLREQGMQAWAI